MSRRRCKHRTWSPSPHCLAAAADVLQEASKGLVTEAQRQQIFCYKHRFRCPPGSQHAKT